MDEKYYYQQLIKEHDRYEERKCKHPTQEEQDSCETNTTYFCLACWKSGHENGKHPYSTPPCDPWRKPIW